MSRTHPPLAVTGLSQILRTFPSNVVDGTGVQSTRVSHAMQLDTV